MSKLTPDNSTPSELTPAQDVQNYMDSKGYEMRLTPLTQVIDGGAVVIQPPQVIIQKKQDTKIVNGTN